MHACAPIRACIRIMRLCVSAYMFFRMHELACACVQKHTSTLFREFLLQQYEFHNAPRHMNEYMYLNVAYISSVGGCAFRFMSAEVYAAFSACILSLQLWFMCVWARVHVYNSVCWHVCVYVYNEHPVSITQAGVVPSARPQTSCLHCGSTQRCHRLPRKEQCLIKKL